MLQKTMVWLIELLFALLLLLGVLWFVVAQPSWVAINQHATPTVNADTLRRTVETLSERLPPRMGMEENLQPTVKWIEQQLQPYGKKQLSPKYKLTRTFNQCT